MATKLGINREQAREIRALLKAGLDDTLVDKLYGLPPGVSRNIGNGILFDEVQGLPKRGNPKITRMTNITHHGEQITNLTAVTSIEWTGVEVAEEV